MRHNLGQRTFCWSDTRGGASQEIWDEILSIVTALLRGTTSRCQKFMVGRQTLYINV